MIQELAPLQAQSVVGYPTSLQAHFSLDKASARKPAHPMSEFNRLGRADVPRRIRRGLIEAVGLATLSPGRQSAFPGEFAGASLKPAPA